MYISAPSNWCDRTCFHLLLTNQDSDTLSAQKDLQLSPYSLSHQKGHLPNSVLYPYYIESMVVLNEPVLCNNESQLIGTVCTVG